jgi:hypothetical protein
MRRAWKRSGTSDVTHKLTNDKFGPLNTTFTYDSTYGELTNIDRGGGANLTVTAESLVGTSANPGMRTADLGGSTTDAAGAVTTYVLDQQGRITGTTLPGSSGPGFGSASESWQRNSAGQVTKYTDTFGRVTTYTYSGADLTKIDWPVNVGGPAAGNWQFSYDPTYHTVTKFTDTLGNVTTFTYRSFAATEEMKTALSFPIMVLPKSFRGGERCAVLSSQTCRQDHGCPVLFRSLDSAGPSADGGGGVLFHLAVLQENCPEFAVAA